MGREGNAQMEQKRKTAYRVLRVLAGAVWLGVIVFAVLHRKELTLDFIMNYTPKNQFLAAGVILGFFALKSLTVVFYSGFLYAACGLLFPLPAALALGVCGTVLMSLISYGLARGLGAGQAEALREKYPKLKEFEDMRSRNNFAFVVVLRCINIVNYDIGSMYCGAVRLPLAPFLLGSLLGKLTDMVMLSVLGTSLEERNSTPFFIALAIDLTIALVVTLWSKKHNAKEKEQHG